MWKVTLASLVLSLSVYSNAYPSEWWKSVSPEEAKSWEILPQQAGSGEVILSKRTELGLLSNFAATPFTLEGNRYASVEGFWQMMKFPENEKDPRATHPKTKWTFQRKNVASLVGFEAKDAGKEGSENMQLMGIDWVTYKGHKMPYRVLKKGEHYHWVLKAMWAKLRQNEEVKQLLLRTGNLKLLPDHKQGEDPPPAWKYHEIWMEIREAIGRNPELATSESHS